MKTIRFLCVLLLSVLLSACSDGNDPPSNNSGKEPAEFLLSSVEMETTFGNTKSEYTYDDKGNLIKTVIYQKGTPYRYEELTYDENGFLVAKNQTTIYASDTESVITESYVNSKKGLVQSGTITTDGVATYISYEYDNKDRVTLYIQKDESDRIIDKRQYEYLDDFGSYRLTNVNNMVYEYVYDAKGNEIKNSVVNSEGYLSVYFEKEYDEHDNLVKTIDKDGEITEYINVYDGDKLISCEISCGDELLYKNLYEYDEYGNLLTKTETNAAGTVESKMVNVWIKVN